MHQEVNNHMMHAHLHKLLTRSKVLGYFLNWFSNKTPSEAGVIQHYRCDHRSKPLYIKHMEPS